jgi:hypothetical protein
MFFAEAQNKLLYATTNQTAAALIVKRADAATLNMGLSTWKGSVVRKQDITVAKNYLTEDELDSLNRLVVIFLETAELRAKNKQDLTMRFWQNNLDKIIEWHGELIQRADPIYKDPQGFRAHFLAPSKKLFGTYITTFSANLMVLWGFSIALAITLYFDALRKAIEWLGEIFKRKKSKA